MSQCGWHSTNVNVENVLGRRFVHVKSQIRTHTKRGGKKKKKKLMNKIEQSEIINKFPI